VGLFHSGEGWFFYILVWVGLLHLGAGGSSHLGEAWVFFILERRGSSSSWRVVGILHLGEAWVFFILERRGSCTSWFG
jgi:hypothetical protein